jgi:uncharacterized protein YcgI (DUF1989 family)
MEEIVIKGGTGHSFFVAEGRRFRVVDVQGKQVSDLVVFLRDDEHERFSPGNTRKLNGRLKISRAGLLYSTKCRPLLRITEDTVGEHDFLFSSCSADDYRVRFGFTTDHNSCLSILAALLAPHGITESMIPDPFNIFQHTGLRPDGELETLEPLSKPGDFVEFQAEADCLVALTACPQDQNPCNGWTITDIKVVSE